MSGAAWAAYPFDEGGEASPRWEERVVHGAAGEPHLLSDPTAEVKVEGGEREVRIDRFTRGVAGVQNLDNPKHLVVSTETFEIPEGGVGTFRAEMRAEKIGSGDVDYRDGFATFNVIDVEHKLVFDVITTGSRIHGLYELQAAPVGMVPQEESFLYVVDNSELGLAPEPGGWHTYEVAIDRARSTIEARVDGRRLFHTGALPVDPRHIKLGMGILTLWPLAADGASTSRRGQGMVAGWRGLATRIEAGTR